MLQVPPSTTHTVAASKLLTMEGTMKRKEKIRQRQDEALDRQTKYDKLSTDEKIELAKSRRGESKKEMLNLHYHKLKKLKKGK